MIRSFRCPDTEALAGGQRVRRFVNIATVARRKLRQLEISARLDDLRVPPGNRLEALKGERMGQYSIRINDQRRVCFRWSASAAEDVEIVDYH
jgi:toxin HigB-1